MIEKHDPSGVILVFLCAFIGFTIWLKNSGHAHEFWAWFWFWAVLIKENLCLLI